MKLNIANNYVPLNKNIGDKVVYKLNLVISDIDDDSIIHKVPIIALFNSESYFKSIANDGDPSDATYYALNDAILEKYENANAYHLDMRNVYSSYERVLPPDNETVDIDIDLCDSDYETDNESDDFDY